MPFGQSGRSIPCGIFKYIGYSLQWDVVDAHFVRYKGPTMHNLSVCFLGDSLIDRPSIVVDNPHFNLPAIGNAVLVRGHETGGFYKLVSQRLIVRFPQQALSFFKFAVGGSTVRDVEQQVHASLSVAPNPTVSIVCVGINDCMRAFQGRHAEGVEMNEFIERYSRIVDALCSRSRLAVCICEPIGDVGEDTVAIREKLKRYNGSIASLVSQSERKNLTCVDLFTRFDEVNAALSTRASQPPLWTDGVHLSEIGNLLAAEEIIRALDKAGIDQLIVSA
jgi:lysophospholipase L1-like esterase